MPPKRPALVMVPITVAVPVTASVAIRAPAAVRAPVTTPMAGLWATALSTAALSVTAIGFLLASTAALAQSGPVGRPSGQPTGRR